MVWGDSMLLSRREILTAGAMVLPAICCPPSRAATGAPEERKRLGVGSASYWMLLSAERRRGGPARFADPLGFVQFCHERGAGGVQTRIRVRDKDYVARLRGKLDAYDMFLEGSIRVPKDRADVDRFDAEVRVAKEAGATVLRVAMGGRRYEVYDRADAYQQFADRSFKSLMLAEPIVARHEMRLAIENHKDWRIDQLVEMLKRLDSQHVGICVDTGNSISLLEDPMDVVEAFAPWAYSVHLKDMAVRPYEDGFLLAGVPLGEGLLDLARMVDLLRRARPEVQFSLEMMTRDPLKIPCLTERYWATLSDVPGSQLARTLAMVRDRAAKRPFPRISDLMPKDKLAAEDNNVRRSLAYAREHLDL